jgi:outer membrane protein insertion porin family
VKITTEPGSSPDRILLNVDVEEQSTGEFSIAGGYSTADGFIGEVSVGERNLLGRGQYAKAALQYGQRTRGFQFSFVEPYFLDYRWSMGYDIFYKNTLASSYTSYDSKTVGGTLRTGFGLTENVALQLSYSIYQREISYSNNYLTVCADQLNPACYTAGVQIPSLPVRIELNSGKTLTSMVGYALAYNSLDNNKNPTSGIYAELKQDFAGLGGDIYFLRNSADVRWYRETLPDIIAVLHLQGGQISGWGSHDLRMLDHFQMGPNLVRGFASNGIGPRDLTPGTTNDAIGGTMYWGASLEFQIPLYFIPKDIGMRGAVFADAGSLWGYKGPTVNPSVPETFLYGDSSAVRSSVGAGIIWDSPLGPLRFDYAIALTKESYDKVQQFRFGGGTKF